MSWFSRPRSEKLKVVIVEAWPGKDSSLTLYEGETASISDHEAGADAAYGNERLRLHLKDGRLYVHLPTMFSATTESSLQTWRERKRRADEEAPLDAEQIGG